jgi:hypothetical protein
MSMRRVDLVLLLHALLIAVAFLPGLAFPEAPLYRDVFSLTVRLYLGGVTKLAALMLGGLFALRVAARFGVGNASRTAFRLLAAWLLLWALGQACLGWYQWVLCESTPFPSLADALFVLGYTCLVAGFALLMRAYLGSGLALGSAREYVRLALLVVMAAGVTGYVVLMPIVRSGGTPLELALNLAYPAFDLVALVPAALLMRVTFRLRGGAVFRVWALVLSGFLAMALGDVLYAYLTMLDVHAVDPLIDVAFIAGYGLVARGMYEQHLLSS